jgi:hypothetical protein
MKKWVLTVLMLATLPAFGQTPVLLVDASGNPYPSGSGTPLPYTPPSMACYTASAGSILPCVFGVPSSGGTFTGPISAPDIASSSMPVVDVTAAPFNAVGDGTTDNCTALTTASNHALAIGGWLQFPGGGVFATSCTVPFQTNWWVQGALTAIVGGTAASTALISTGTSQTMDHKGIYGPGVINGNALSPAIVWVQQGRHINISVGAIVGMAVNGKGVYFGDDSGVGAGGYEGSVYEMGFGFHSNPPDTGSICVYISGGNGTQGAFTDDKLVNNVFHGCSIGYQDHAGGNNYFSGNHAWDQSLTVCFDEEAGGGTMIGEYCDSPSLYGFHIHTLQTNIIGGIAFNGANRALDNVATAIEYDNTAEPQSMVYGIRIYGTDASHRWAADTNLGFSSTQSVWCNVRDGSNVVTRQQGNNCLQGQAQIIFSGFQMKNGGTLSSAPASQNCNGTCAIAAGGNIRVITLTGSVTSSTFTLTTPSGATNGIFVVAVCQNATGGFTFVPPANWSGFGTIGTTANKCSTQNMWWDGTTLRATGTMQINE